MEMKKIILTALVAAIVLTMSATAFAQEANEWSQYQKNVEHAGTMNVDLPATNQVSRRTDNIGAREGSQPVVAGSKAYVYAGLSGSSGAIYCYDLTTGAKAWNTSIEPVSSFDSWSTPAVAGGVVYIGSGSKVQALDAGNGKLLWTKDLNSIRANSQVVNGSPAVDGNHLIIGDYGNGYYYCLDTTQKGKLMWGFALDASCIATSTPCVDGNRVFVGQGAAYLAPISPNGKVWCVDIATGKAVKTWGTNGYYATAGKLDVAGSASCYGDFIYFTDFTYGSASSPNCHIYCLNKATGAEAWKKSVYGSDGPPAVTDGYVVTCGQQPGAWPAPGTNWTTAFRVNTVAGKDPVQAWTKSGMGGYTVSPSIANGRVGVGTMTTSYPSVADGTYVLNLTDGSTVWHSAEGGAPTVPTPHGMLSLGGGKMITFGTGSLPNGDYYFAEGTTRPGYQEWICLENPTAAQEKAYIEYIMADGSTLKQDVALPRQSRTTVDVNAFIGAGKDASAHVAGDGYFVAERSMYFASGGLDGGEQVMGVTNPGLHFLYAEGTTRDGFKTWLALQNPQSSDANVLITYLYGDSSAPVQQNVRIGAKSRQTIDVNAAAGANKDVSISVAASKPVVSERVMYFTYPLVLAGSHPSGVHNCTGVASAGTSWYFAEGATYGNFSEYLCLMNPRGTDTTATITYMKGTGPGKTVTKALKANSRTTVNVNEDVGPDQDVSALVTAPDPIVAERPMYFLYAPVATTTPAAGGNQGLWKGGHNSAGAVYEAYKWEFAEGCTRDGFQTYLCMANPNDVTANVGITYYIYKPDGTSKAVKDVTTIAAHARRTILLNQVVGTGADVSATVTCTIPIVAERPMYFSYSGYTDGGVSLGLPGSP
jgi:outer membrane protein assembly factor BamB